MRAAPVPRESRAGLRRHGARSRRATRLPRRRQDGDGCRATYRGRAVHGRSEWSARDRAGGARPSAPRCARPRGANPPARRRGRTAARGTETSLSLGRTSGHSMGGIMKKAIGDNMIPRDWGLERGLDLIKNAGYDGVELWLGEMPWFQMTTTDGDVRELRRKVENAGLRVSNVSTGMHWSSPLSARDPAVRAKAGRIVERQIETAEILGTDAILVVAGLVTEEVPYTEVYQRCVDALKALAPAAQRAGVKIGCENCNSEQRFLLSPREFAEFLNDVNSPAVGIHLDVGNIHDTGFAEQWIEIHGPRITRVHLKDVLKHRGRSGDQSVYTNLFLGDNNWAAIRAALTKVGYDGWLIAEMEARYRFAPDQQFYDTAQAIDRLIAGRL